MKLTSHLVIGFAAAALFSQAGFADESRPKAETVPTSVPVETAEQKAAHDTVAKDQEKLKKKLKQRASPAEIGKAKAKVQTDRTKANKVDATLDAKEKSADDQEP